MEEIQKLVSSSTVELQNTIRRLGQDITKLNSKVAALEDDNTELKRKVERLERRNRKNNLVIFGFPHNSLRAEELAGSVITELKRLLGLDVELRDIDNAYYIGNPNKSKRPVLLQLTSCLIKNKIFSNVYKLKGKGISISHDLSSSEREVNKVLVEHLKRAKARKLVAFIRRDKLHIGEEVYTYQQLIERGEQIEQPLDTDTEVFASPLPRQSISAPSTPTIHEFDNSAPAENQNAENIVASSVNSDGTVDPPSLQHLQSAFPPVHRAVIGNNNTTQLSGSAGYHKANAEAANSVPNIRTSTTPTTQVGVGTRTRLKSTRIQGQSVKK